GHFWIRNLCYGMVLLLFVSAAWVLFDTRVWLRRTIIGLHLMTNFVIWVCFSPSNQAISALGLAGWSFPACFLAASAFAGISQITLRMPGALEDGQSGDIAKLDDRRAPVSNPLYVFIACATLLLFLGVVVLAIHQTKSSETKAQLQNIVQGHKLFDGRSTENENYAMIPNGVPATIRFKRNITADEIKLYLFDRDGRSYRFTVEAENFGKWHMLMDSSTQDRSGPVSIHVPPYSVSALRLTGLHHSRQLTEP